MEMMRSMSQLVHSFFSFLLTSTVAHSALFSLGKLGEEGDINKAVTSSDPVPLCQLVTVFHGCLTQMELLYTSDPNSVFRLQRFLVSPWISPPVLFYFHPALLDFPFLLLLIGGSWF